MTSYTLKTRLAELGILMPYSRPRVSNDNPYSEAMFRTVKESVIRTPSLILDPATFIQQFIQPLQNGQSGLDTMPRSRKSQIALEATPYYHCTSRCVRRAFLCGRDEHPGNDYEHRRGWIEQRMLQLAEVYALDICANAVMSNHYHIVLHINAEKAKVWTDSQVVERWHTLYSGNFLTQQYMAGKDLYEEQLKAIAKLAAEWRDRLMSISWFMRALNEDIARQANAVDGCTGRFWEARFKSQALLDEKALATWPMLT